MILLRKREKSLQHAITTSQKNFIEKKQVIRIKILSSSNVNSM